MFDVIRLGERYNFVWTEIVGTNIAMFFHQSFVHGKNIFPEFRQEPEQGKPFFVWDRFHE